MNVKLDWQIGDEDRKPPEKQQRRWPVASLLVALSVVLAVGLFLRFRGASVREEAEIEEGLRQIVQDRLDEEQLAYLSGDGDRFLARQSAQPAWISAQLQPENQFPYRSGLTVTRVDRDGDELWINASWRQDGETYQKVMFFRLASDGLVHVPGAEAFWGTSSRQSYSWGELRLHQADRDWSERLNRFVADIVADLCSIDAGGNCLRDRVPFTLTIATDYETTAATRQLRVPSPRLVAMDGSGEPADIFWDRLRQELVAYLTPSQIRFAVPEGIRNRNELTDYQKLAAEFSAARPDIEVEIVGLSQLPPDPLSWTTEVDGAAIPPTLQMLTTGLVFDLTDFIETDDDFDEVDFYEQIWQGARWQGRMWFLPQGGALSLLFYDKGYYREAGLDEPTIRWTWEKMTQDIAVLGNTEPQEPSVRADVAFLDLERHTPFSYAYGLDPICVSVDSGFCPRFLRPEPVAEALSWFKVLVDNNLMPDLTGMTDEERDFASYNIRAALWVERPILYEHHLLLRPIGVTTFPGIDGTEGVTPLWVNGSFISQSSGDPRAVWEWLKFLTYQLILPGRRHVPARPSVANAEHFWTTLPRPLGQAMRAALPFAQPVRISEREQFEWSILSRVLAGELSPEGAARLPESNRWFLPVR